MGSHRIAVVIDHSSFMGYRLMSGLLRRATALPDLLVRRYFMDALAEEGIDRLIDWKPDALIAFCGNVPLLRNAREVMPRIPVVVMNTVPDDLYDAIVGGSAAEVISLSLDHFSENGLKHFGLFFMGPDQGAEHYKQRFLDGFEGRSAEPHCFTRDIHVESLLGTPAGEDADQVRAWLQSLPKPIGILAPATHSAAYLVRICNQHNIPIPEDVQIIGSDELDEALECLPHLTSVSLPCERIGAASLKTAISLLQGEHLESKSQPVHGISLIPQGSTGMVPSQLSDISAAISFIESQATQGATVNDVLNQTQSVSRMTFYREFKEQTGESPANYIRRTRIEAAQRMLATSQLDITRIAELTGFSGSNYFAQVFRRETGMSPNQYRKSHNSAE